MRFCNSGMRLILNVFIERLFWFRNVDMQCFSGLQKRTIPTVFFSWRLGCKKMWEMKNEWASEWGDIKESCAPGQYKQTRQRSRAGAKHEGMGKEDGEKWISEKEEEASRSTESKRWDEARIWVSVLFLLLLWRSDKQAQTDIRTARKVLLLVVDVLALSFSSAFACLSLS